MSYGRLNMTKDCDTIPQNETHNLIPFLLLKLFNNQKHSYNTNTRFLPKLKQFNLTQLTCP